MVGVLGAGGRLPRQTGLIHRQVGGLRGWRRETQVNTHRRRTSLSLYGQTCPPALFLISFLE